MKTPAGWFVVAYSSELPLRGVLPLRYFGEPLLMFRGADGNAVVLGADARSFDGIPYHRKVPRTTVRSWPVCERNGMLLVHFHPTREAPAGEIPSLPEYNSPAWTSYVTRRWTMDSDARVKLVGADFRLRTRAEMPTPFGTVAGILDIQSLGAGFSVVRFTGAVETLLMTTVTPIDDDHVDARFTFSVKRLTSDADTSAIQQRFVEELEREVESDLRMHTGVAPRRRLPTHDEPSWSQPHYV